MHFKGKAGLCHVTEDLNSQQLPSLCRPGFEPRPVSVRFVSVQSGTGSCLLLSVLVLSRAVSLHHCFIITASYISCSVYS